MVQIGATPSDRDGDFQCCQHCGVLLPHKQKSAGEAVLPGGMSQAVRDPTTGFTTTPEEVKYRAFLFAEVV